MKNIKQTKDVGEFIRTIFAHATFPRRKNGYTIEVKGDIKEEKKGNYANSYLFTATLSSGTIYNNVRKMEEYIQFSEIYEHPHDEKNHLSESEEIFNRLNYLADKARKLPETSNFYIPKIARNKTLETALEKEVLIVYPFQ